MVRRLVLLVMALGLAVPALASSATASAAQSTWFVRVSDAFSPNGDGRRDDAVVRFELTETGDVSLLVQSEGDDNLPVTHRSVQLGQHAAGKHAWRWDGRDDQGTRLPEGYYTVEMTVTDADGTRVVKWDSTQLDTSVSVRLWPSNTYGLPSATQAVYPRTEVVRDVLALSPILREDVEWATLLIKDRSGRTVLSRDVSKWRTSRKVGDDVSWTARLGGQPLTPGRYRAFVRAEDRLGNVGRSDAAPLRVSRKVLQWRKATRVVVPATSAEAEMYCGFTGCYGDDPRPCGTVAPSAFYPGGVSYRAGECPPASAGNTSRAGEGHYLPVPAAVRGVAAARIAFEGRPTVEGEDDAGALSLRSQLDFGDSSLVTSSTGARTAWVSCPSGCMGGEQPDFLPGVLWSFGTSGTDAVDVASFTVTMRFLAVND